MLLLLLALVPDEQLSRNFSGSATSPPSLQALSASTPSRAVASTSTAAERKAVLEFWARHPLRTAADVQKWRDDLSGDSPSPAFDTGVRQDLETGTSVGEAVNTWQPLSSSTTGLDSGERQDVYGIVSPQTQTPGRVDFRLMNTTPSPSGLRNTVLVQGLSRASEEDNVADAVGSQLDGAGSVIPVRPGLGRGQGLRGTEPLNDVRPSHHSVGRVTRSNERVDEATHGRMDISKEFQLAFVW